jgi:DMSO/TMAO reductase YedYZ molybdopterin-dependent catalytic subunit
MRFYFKVLVTLVAVLIPISCVFAQGSAATISIGGDVQKPAQWSVDTLKTQFAGQIQEIKFTAGMDKSVKMGTGIPLLSVIEAAGPKAEKGPKHPEMGFLIILEAHDSYRVFFSLPELMPKVGHAQAWLIWNVDGTPLSDKEAPLRLVVTTDQGPDRGIYGLVKVTMVDGNKLAGQLKTN